MPLFRREKRGGVPAGTDASTLGNPLGSIPSNVTIGRTSMTGVAVTESSALSISQVYACVRILGDAVSSLPLKAYGQIGNVKQQLNPQPQLLLDPFAGLTLGEGLFQLVSSLALRGNAFAIKVRDAGFNVTQLVICHPDWVQVKRDSSGAPIYVVNNYPIAPADMVHVRNFMLPGSISGLDPITVWAQELGLSIATQRFGAAFFGNGATLTGVLQNSDGDLTDDEAKRMAEQFEANHAGVNKSHLPLVLTAGMKFQPISVTPENAQFLGTRTFENGEIAKMFGIPPHMLGDTDRTTSWGSGIEAQGRGFVTYTLRAYLSKIEQAVATILPGLFIRFDTTELTRGDGAARTAYYHAGLSDGWLCADDVRAMEDMPPLPEGQGRVFRHPVTQTDIEAAPTPATPGTTTTIPPAVLTAGDLDAADVDPNN